MAWQFNETVYTVGTFAEAKLAERDKKGRARWTLEDVLEGRAKRPPKAPRTSTLAQLRAAFGSAVGELR